MKKRFLSVFLSYCVMIALFFAFSITASASSETVTLSPVFTNGTTYPSYNVTDGSGNVTADGFIAGNGYSLSVSMTAATLTSPNVVITVPKNFDITFWTPADNTTIAPYLASSAPINPVTDAEGNKTLTYNFKDHTAAVGFTVTVRPTFKLKDGQTYTVKTELLSGSAPVSASSASVNIYNPTIHNGSFYSYDNYYSNPLSYNLNDATVQTVPIFGYLYSNYSNRYPYDETKIVIPLPAQAMPGYLSNGAFTELNDGEPTNITNGTVTYVSNYQYSSASFKALVYIFNSSHSMSQGSYSYWNFSDSSFGNIRLKFPVDTSLSTNQAFYSPYKIQVSAKIDGSSDFTTLLDFQSGYALQYTYKLYNLSDYFYEGITYSNAKYECYSNVLPIEDNTYSRLYYTNNTGEILTNVITETAFPAELYANKLAFTFNANSSYPSKATVLYKTKKGVDTLYPAEMTPDNLTISLSDPADCFTYVKITYDKFGTGSIYPLNVYLANRDQINTGYSFTVTSKILSANCPASLIGSGIIPQQPQQSFSFYPNTSFAQVYPYTFLSKSALNKGDSFSINIYPTYYLNQLFTDLTIYILMPYEYPYTGYSTYSGFEGGTPVHQTRTITVPSDKATSQMPVGTYTLHKFTFPGEYKINAYGTFNFNFMVGTLVDTATTRSNVYLPAAIAFKETNPYFQYSSSFRMTDSWDFDGDSDITESLTTSSSLPTVTINAASALDAKSYLTSNYAEGSESTAQSYQFNSEGSYKFYLYNGLASGNSASDVTLDISIPKNGTSFVNSSTTYTSAFNAIVTGAPEITDETGFLAGASVNYSIDGGQNYSTETPTDWGLVTNVHIQSAPGKYLANAENAIIEIPFRTDFGKTVTSGSRAYFNNTLKFKLTSSGDQLNAIDISPVTLQPAPVAFTGTVYQDLNGNLMKDQTENANGSSYPVKLYSMADDTPTLLATVYSNSSTGAYSFNNILLPGDYKIEVVKSSQTQYFPDGTDGTYTFTADDSHTSFSNINFGILVPRTLNIKINNQNVSTFRLVNGTNSILTQIKPEVIPPLNEGESIVYTSSNESAATVSEDGTLSYVSDGTATITVTIPQLQSVIDASGGKLESTVSKQLTVTSENNTCTIASNPYIGETSNASISNAIISSEGACASSGIAYSKTFYYFLNRSGYCNNPDHQVVSNPTVTWSIDNASTTAPGAQIVQSGTNVTLTATGGGTIVLKAAESEDDGHAYSTPLTLTVTIAKAKVTKPTVTNTNLTYNGNTQNAVISSSTYYTVTNDSKTNAGSYSATVSLKDTSRYEWSDETTADLSLNWSINKANLTVKANNNSITYGDAPAASGYVISGFKGSDSQSNVTITGMENLSYTYNYAQYGNVGSYMITPDCSGLSSLNYTFISSAGTLTVNPKPVTLAYYSDTDNTYDDSDFTYDAKAHTVTALVVNAVNSDAVSVTAYQNMGSNVNNAVNAASYIATATALSNSNYTLTGGTNIQVSWTINKAPITVTADDVTVTYDGLSHAGKTATASGDKLVEGHYVYSVTISGSYKDYDEKGYYLTSSNAAIKDAAGNYVTNNYSISYANGTLKINKAELTITAKDKSIVYGEVPSANGYTVTGLKGSDSAGLISGLDAMGYQYDYEQFGDVGSYTITPDILGLTALNYTFKTAPGNLAVSQKPVALAYYSDTDNLYDDSDFSYEAKAHTVTALVVNAVNGDEITVTSYQNSANDVNSAINAGSYIAKAASLSNANYTLTGGTNTEVSWTINKAPITVTADDVTVTYDGSYHTGTKATASGERLINGHIVETVTITGSSGRDYNKSNYTLTPSNAAIKDADGNDVTANYSITYKNGTLTVNKRFITMTADGDSKIYDGIPLTKRSYTLSGELAAADTIYSVNMTSGSSIIDVGTTKNTIETVVIKSGDRDVTANYEITLADGNLSVTSRPITLLADSSQKIYDAQALTVNGYTLKEGTLASTDSFYSVQMTKESTITGAGTTQNIIDSVIIKRNGTDVTSNYQITKEDGTLTVDQRPVTVTADSAEKIYDGTALARQSSTEKTETEPYKGLINGHFIDSSMMDENSTITYVGSAENKIAAVVIKDAEGNDVTNYYNITKIAGILTVTPPIVKTDMPTYIDKTFITLNGSLTKAAKDMETGFYCRKSEDSDFTRQTAEGSTASEANLISYTLTGLTAGTEYEYYTFVKVNGVEYSDYPTLVKFKTVKEEVSTPSIEVTLNGPGNAESGSVAAEVKNPSGAAEAKSFSVTIEAGNTVLATATGILNIGDYAIIRFNHLQDGIYNIVTRSGNWTETKIITVKSGSSEAASFTIPATSGKTNSLITIQGENTPKAAADGLNTLFTGTDESAAGSGNTVNIVLTVEKKDEFDNGDGETQNAVEKIHQISQSENVVSYLNLTVTKTITDSTGNVTDQDMLTAIGKIVEIAIPMTDDMRGKVNYKAYRVHNGNAQLLPILTERQDIGKPSAKEGYFADASTGYIFIYTKNFSIYAIGYDNPVDSPTYFTITASCGEGGKIDPESATIEQDCNKIFTITPNPGYEIKDVLVDGITKKGYVTIKNGVGTFNLEHINDNHEVVAVFQKAGTEAPRWNPFIDVKDGNWFYNNVKYVFENGLMTGTAQDKFSPYGNTTRGMIVTILYRLEKTPEVSSNLFEDVTQGKWYFDAVNWAGSHDIVSGYGNNQFGPEDNITREQMAVILYHYAKFKGYDVSAAGDPFVFSDSREISTWAQEEINWAIGSNLLTGKGDGILDPGGTATRAEVATILQRFIENLN